MALLPVPPDPSALTTVRAVHLALWRSTIANACHHTSSHVDGISSPAIETLHTVVRAAYHLAGGIVVHDRLGEGYDHERALLSALELRGDVDP